MIIMCIRFQLKKTNVPGLNSIICLSAPSISPLDNDVIYILVLNCQLTLNLLAPTRVGVRINP